MYCIEETSSRFQYSTSSYRSRAFSKNQVLVNDSCHRHYIQRHYIIPFFDSVPPLSSPKGGFCFIFHLLVSNIYNMSPFLYTSSLCRLYSLCNDTKQITPPSSLVRDRQFCVEILLCIVKSYSLKLNPPDGFDFSCNPLLTVTNFRISSINRLIIFSFS